MTTPIVLLMGPTALGKTALAMALQDKLGGPDRVSLISVDSALVYRGMDIGTAKPTASELAAYPHALIDIRDPAEPYTAADFVADADAAVEEARRAGRVPILVGGTMLYFRRFVDGIAALPRADANTRAALAEELASRGGEALHAELTRIDPEAAVGIHPNNPQRLLRALEIVRLTGVPVSAQWRELDSGDVVERLGGEVLTYALEPEHRSVLHERIAERFDAMLAQGFVEELKALTARGDLHPDLPSMRAVGYRQGLELLAGDIDAAGFREQTVVATRRLAKRQLTWLRSWPGAVHLQADDALVHVARVARDIGNQPGVLPDPK